MKKLSSAHSSMLLILVVIFCIAPVISSCGKKSDAIKKDARIICVIGGVTLTDQNGGRKAAATGAVVIEEDGIETDKGALAVIQIGETGIIRITENSKVQFKKLVSQSSVELMLNQGSVSSKVALLKKDQ